MASANISNNNTVNQQQQPMDTNTAAAILSQFDQNTQLQALAMLRQLNAQQQLQQFQQLQQLQQLQTLQSLQKMSLDGPTTNISNNNGQASPVQNLGAHQKFSDSEIIQNAQMKSKMLASSNPARRVISSAMRPAKMSVTTNSICNTSGQGLNSMGSHSGIVSAAGSIHHSSFGQSSKGESTKPSSLSGKYDQASLGTFQPIKKEVGPDGESFIVPNDELIDQIVIASEYYFSDENLAKDHYLLRQICQKSEGFLSIKLLTALKNVKRLTKDWRVTSYALKKSTKLQLNGEETKVKRIAVLPDQVLKARQITNVIAIRIPMEFSSVSSITQLFAQYGKITLVRVLLPGRQVPCDLRNYATQVPDMGNSLCAVVEYDTEVEACTACRELNSKRYSSGLRSALLGPRLRRNLYKALPEGEELELPTQQGATKAGLANSHLHTTNNAWNKAVVIDGKSQLGSKGGSHDGSSSGKHKDSGCDTASSHSSSSPPVSRKSSDSGLTFDRAPGAHRKSVKMQINISQQSAGVLRQPKGPTTGVGFSFNRILPSANMVVAM